MGKGGNCTGSRTKKEPRSPDPKLPPGHTQPPFQDQELTCPPSQWFPPNTHPSSSPHRPFLPQPVLLDLSLTANRVLGGFTVPFPRWGGEGRGFPRECPLSWMAALMQAPASANKLWGVGSRGAGAVSLLSLLESPQNIQDQMSPQAPALRPRRCRSGASAVADGHGPALQAPGTAQKPWQEEHPVLGYRECLSAPISHPQGLDSPQLVPTRAGGTC